MDCHIMAGETLVCLPTPINVGNNVQKFGQLWPSRSRDVPARHKKAPGPRMAVPGTRFTYAGRATLSLRPALAVGAELLHELLGAGDDGVAAGLEELARVVALAVLVLAGLDVLAGGLGEDELEVGVDVDLADAEGDVSALIAASWSKDRPSQLSG